jgi:nucleoid-associated protein YgaU
MAATRGIQAAIAVAGVAVLAILIYVFGVPKRPEPQTAETPVAAAPTVPSQTTPAPEVAPRAPTGEQAAVPSATAPTAGSPAQAPAPAKSAPAKSAEAAPAFDVVRVEPDGSSVVAGRAPPGAKVELLRNGQPIGEATADPSGAFAMTPPALPPGTHELSLRVSADGRSATSGEAVTVVVADDRKTAPVVALTAPDKPTVVLSKPEGTAQTALQPGATGTASPQAQPAGQAAVAARETSSIPGAVRPSIVIEVVEADAGRMFVSGIAAAAATVRLYLNETYLASAVAANDGRLSFTIAKGLAPGDYRVRLDDVDPHTGRVLSRAEVAFAMPVGAVASAGGTRPAAGRQESAAPGATSQPGAQVAANGTVPANAATDRPIPGVAPAPSSVPPASAPAAQNPGRAAPAQAVPAPPPGVVASGSASAVVIPEVQTATVTRGDSLWRISRRTYGRGARYTVIYDANQDQIRDADLIYPNQVFVLPNEQAAGARAP